MAALRSVGGLAAALLLLIACWLVGSASAASDAKSLARGWGDDLPWQTLEDAKSAAKADGTGTMVLIWKTWCGACKSLRPRFAASTAIATALRESGTKVVNLVDDENEGLPSDYSPDGGYIPRIIFLDSAGKRLPVSSGNAKYQAFFSDPDAIARAVRDAAKMAGAGGKGDL